MNRRLTRDTKNAVLGGVAAGFARYFGADPVLVRIVFVALSFVNGFGLVAYLVGWMIMPRDDRGDDAAGPPGAGVVEKVREAGERVAAEFRGSPSDATRGRLIGGVVLIALGTLLLLDRLSWWHWPQWARLSNLWPLVLIGVGVSIILEATRGRGGKRT